MEHKSARRRVWWGPLARLWNAYRHVAAIRGLLDWIGLWGFMASTLTSVGMGVGSVLSGLPWPVTGTIVILVFAGTSALWHYLVIASKLKPSIDANGAPPTFRRPEMLPDGVTVTGGSWQNEYAPHATDAIAPAGIGPIRAWIKILFPQSSESGPHVETGWRLVWPVQIVNREASPLVLRAEYEEVSDQGRYTAYVVSLDGQSPHTALAVKPDEVVNTTAVITPFAFGVPPDFSEKYNIKYPSSTDTNVQRCLVLTDVKTNRKAVVSSSKDYDVGANG